MCTENILYPVFSLYCTYLIEFYIFKMILVCIRKLLSKRKWGAQLRASGPVQKAFPLCSEACNTTSFSFPGTIL